MARDGSALSRFIRMVAVSAPFLSAWSPAGAAETTATAAGVTTGTTVSLADPNTTVTKAPSFRRTEDLNYGRKHGMALTMDVFSPTGKANGAGIALLVSSGWGSSKAGISTRFIEPFTRRGFTVFAVVHSSAPRFFIPEIIPDIGRALRYLHANARTHGVDPDRIGTIGASAGGHLALMLATDGGAPPAGAASPDPVDRQTSAVKGAVAFFPPTDFNNYVGPAVNALDESALKNYRKSIGPVPDDQEAANALGRSISPIYGVTSGTAPVLIFHGEKDYHVLPHQSKSFVEKARKAGVDATVVMKPGAPHAYKGMLDDLETAADWFEKHL